MSSECPPHLSSTPDALNKIHNKRRTSIFTRAILYSVRHSRKRAPLNRGSLGASIVPQNDFPRVGAAENQIRMEARKTARENWTLAVEDVLGSRFLEAGVPH